MNETKLDPLYKQMAQDIIKRVEKEGYGFLITIENLYDGLAIHEPKQGSYKEFKAYSLKRMNAIENLKDDLLDVNIFLMSVRGIGYRVLNPSEQIIEGPKMHLKKAMTQIKKAMKSVTNVDVTQLSSTEEATRISTLSRLSFIQSATRKRKYLKPPE